MQRLTREKRDLTGWRQSDYTTGPLEGIPSLLILPTVMLRQWKLAATTQPAFAQALVTLHILAANPLVKRIPDDEPPVSPQLRGLIVGRLREALNRAGGAQVLLGEPSSSQHEAAQRKRSLAALRGELSWYQDETLDRDRARAACAELKAVDAELKRLLNPRPFGGQPRRERDQKAAVLAAALEDLTRFERNQIIAETLEMLVGAVDQAIHRGREHFLLTDPPPSR